MFIVFTEASYLMTDEPPYSTASNTIFSRLTIINYVVLVTRPNFQIFLLFYLLRVK